MNRFYFLLAMVWVCSCKPKDTAGTSMVSKSMTTNQPSFFELRTYYCYPDKLDDLLTRFNDHTMALFEKHGMVNIGYWLPIENEQNKLIYLMGYDSQEARDDSWKAFGEDPQWKRVWQASQENGPIVDSVVSQYFTYTDYSPKIIQEDKSPRIFSIRTYITNEGKLENLHTRFRNHTMKIFENNGMTNIAYFNLMEDGKTNDNTLVYMLSFPDTGAQKESWKRFLADPDWKTVYAKSIVDGKIVDSISDILLEPTLFSPIK